VVASTLSVSLEELFGQAKQASRARCGPPPKWQQQVKQIATLPRAQQQVVMQMLDGLPACEAR